MANSNTSLKEVGIPDATNTLKQSTKFIKRLVAIGFSQIVYLRSGLPEQCFQSFGDDRLGLKMIKDKTESLVANKLTKGLKNAMTAFDHGYLKELDILILKNKNLDEDVDIFEKYSFKFTKRSGDHSGSTELTLDFTSPRNLNQSIDLGGSDIDSAALHEATKNLLIQFINVMQSQEELPRPSYMTFTIRFHDDAPEGYQPTGYCPGSSNLSRAVEKRTTSESIGKMKTKFHGFGLQLSSHYLKKASKLAVNEKENVTDGGEQFNESIIDMNPGLDTTILEHNRVQVSADTPANISKAQSLNVNHSDKQPKSKSAKKKASTLPSGHGDTANKQVPLMEKHLSTNNITPGNSKGFKIARDESQASLNSSARSSKVLIATRRALSVKDTFYEGSAATKYVKASRCTRMIPF